MKAEQKDLKVGNDLSCLQPFGVRLKEEREVFCLVFQDRHTCPCVLAKDETVAEAGCRGRKEVDSWSRVLKETGILGRGPTFILDTHTSFQNPLHNARDSSQSPSSPLVCASFCLSLFLMTLAVLRTSGQVFCRMPSAECVSCFSHGPSSGKKRIL